MSSISLAKVPREVPNRLKVKLIFVNFTLWFGLFFFVFSSIVLAFFATQIDIKSFVFFPNQKTQGIIIAKESANGSINKKTVHKYTYKFSVGHRQLTGYSYTQANVDPYQPVQIEYEGSSPQNSRIVGMRLATFPFWILLFVLIFPVVGFSIIWATFRDARKDIYWASHGIVTKGKVIASEKTNLSRNKKPLYEISFEFHDQSGKLIQSKCTTTAPEKVMDEAEEFLVYESQTPQKAVLLDTINKSVKLFLINQYNQQTII